MVQFCTFWYMSLMRRRISWNANHQNGHTSFCQIIRWIYVVMSTIHLDIRSIYSLQLSLTTYVHRCLSFSQIRPPLITLFFIRNRFISNLTSDAQNFKKLEGWDRGDLRNFPLLNIPKIKKPIKKLIKTHKDKKRTKI